MILITVKTSTFSDSYTPSRSFPSHAVPPKFVYYLEFLHQHHKKISKTIIKENRFQTNTANTNQAYLLPSPPSAGQHTLFMARNEGLQRLVQSEQAYNRRNCNPSHIKQTQTFT